MKNFIGITSSTVEEKATGLICTTGPSMSYLASGDFSKFLAYEPHALLIQLVVCSSYEDVNDRRLESQKVEEKLNSMKKFLVEFLKA